MATTGMLEVSSTVRGYHVYKRRWDATIGEVLQAEREGPRNVHDRYAVTLTKEGLGTVGHVPKKISKLCNSFLARGGEIEAVITGSRQYADDLPALAHSQLVREELQVVSLACLLASFPLTALQQAEVQGREMVLVQA